VVGAVGIQDALDAKDAEMAEYGDHLERLISGIDRTAAYFNSGNLDTPISRIVLCGPYSAALLVQQELQDASGIKTILSGDAPEFKPFRQLNPGDTILYAPTLVGSTISPIDILGAEEQSAKGKQKGQKTHQSIASGVLLCATLVIASAALVYFAYTRKAEAEQKLSDIQRQIESLSYAEEVYKTYTLYQNGVAALDEIKASVWSRNDELTAFLEELEDKILSDITILNATFTESGVSMSVTVPDKAAAARTIVQLKAMSTIAVVSVGSISEAGGGEDGIPYVSFSVSCAYAAAGG